MYQCLTYHLLALLCSKFYSLNIKNKVHKYSRLIIKEAIFTIGRCIGLRKAISKCAFTRNFVHQIPLSNDLNLHRYYNVQDSRGIPDWNVPEISHNKQAMLIVRSASHIFFYFPDKDDIFAL